MMPCPVLRPRAVHVPSPLLTSIPLPLPPAIFRGRVRASPPVLLMAALPLTTIFRAQVRASPQLARLPPLFLAAVTPRLRQPTKQNDI